MASVSVTEGMRIKFGLPALESAQVGNVLHDLVAGLHRLAVQLESPLGGDQVNQFLDRLNVGGFQVPLPQLTQPVLGRATRICRPGRVGGLIQIFAEFQQAVVVDELSQFDLSNVGQFGLPGKLCPDFTAVADRDVLGIVGDLDRRLQ